MITAFFLLSDPWQFQYIYFIAESQYWEFSSRGRLKLRNKNLICKWLYGEKPWVFEEGFIKQKDTDLVLGVIDQSNEVTVQKLETDNPSQKWGKRGVNWDDDGDEKDYQLIHEESGRFLTARELSLTVEKKGKVSFLFSKSDAMN